MADIHSSVEKCCVLYFETENLVILSVHQVGLIKKQNDCNKFELKKILKRKCYTRISLFPIDSAVIFYARGVFLKTITHKVKHY